MIISLENGKQIEMSLSHFLSLTDEEFDELVKSDAGYEYTDPFMYSILESNISEEIEEIEEIEEEIDDEIDYDFEEDI